MLLQPSPASSQPASSTLWPKFQQATGPLSSWGKKEKPQGVCLWGGQPIVGVSVSLPWFTVVTRLLSAACRPGPEALSGLLCGWTWVGTSSSLAFGSWGQSGARPAGAFVLSAPPPPPLPREAGQGGHHGKSYSEVQFLPHHRRGGPLNRPGPRDTEMTPLLIKMEPCRQQGQERVQATACSTPPSVSQKEKGRLFSPAQKGL